MNAFRPPLIGELSDALDRAVADPEIRAVVVTGAGAGIFRRHGSRRRRGASA